MRYCESPSRFQGKPPKMRAKIISNATHVVAARKAQDILWAQVDVEISRAAVSQSGASATLRRAEGNEPSESQTHVAGNSDRNAASAIQPTMGNPVTGMFRS